ncbi:MerR family transcriptional regulator [Glycocaulis profundi]|nr:MerR family transcriptional regulator [Glycocaulis profundi]
MTDKSPDAYRTISEAAEEAGLPAHVLRFWETKFTQLKPVKRKGGRRLYRPQDVLLLKGLRRLLYDEGYTIKGAQKYLRENGVSSVGALGAGEAEPQTPEPAAAAPATGEAAPAAQGAAQANLGAETTALIERALGRLQAARQRLDAALQA